MNRPIVCSFAGLLAILGVATATIPFATLAEAAPRGATPSPSASGPAAVPAAASPTAPPPAAPPAGSLTAAPGTVPPSPAAAPRRPRSYAQCNRVSQQRRLRGSDRRHFVQRCQLGYGRALFRRRSER